MGRGGGKEGGREGRGRGREGGGREGGREGRREILQVHWEGGGYCTLVVSNYKYLCVLATNSILM